MEALEGLLDALRQGAYVWSPAGPRPGHELHAFAAGGAGAEALAALLSLESHYYNLAFHQEGGGQIRYADLAGALEQAASDSQVKRSAAWALQDAARASHARAVLVATYASLAASASHAAPPADLPALCGALAAAIGRLAPAERQSGPLAPLAARIRLEIASLGTVLDAAGAVAEYRYLEAVLGLQTARGALEAWTAALAPRPPPAGLEKAASPPIALVGLQWSLWHRLRAKAAVYFHRFAIGPREEALAAAAAAPNTVAAAALATAIASGAGAAAPPAPAAPAPRAAPHARPMHLASTLSGNFAPTLPPLAAPAAAAPVAAAFAPLRTTPDLIAMLESVVSKLDALFIALVLDSAEVPCYHEEGYRVCGECEAPTGLRSYPAIFLYPPRTSTVEHWPTVVSLIVEQQRASVNWGAAPLSYHEPKAQDKASYVLARVDPAVALVLACRGQRRAGERAVQEAAGPALEALRGADLLARLARRTAPAR